jgi:membrane associated rhomboid family serine protease
MLPLKDNVPTRTFPVVTVTLIAVNVVVWLWEWKSGVQTEVLRYGYYPCDVDGPCVAPASQVHHLAWLLSVFTAMFMHAGWLHIGGNMLFLWIFGNNVEDAMGRFRFLVFYLLAGVAAMALQTVVTLHWAGASGASVPNIGASGAIAGVLGAYIVLLPNARVLTAVFVFFILFWEIPAIFFIGIWFLIQVVSGGFGLTHPGSGGGVAFFAHVGGFAFGFLAVRVFAVRKPLQPAW